MKYDAMLRDAQDRLVAVYNDPVAQAADLHRRQAKADGRKGNKPRRSRAVTSVASEKSDMSLVASDRHDMSLVSSVS